MLFFKLLYRLGIPVVLTLSGPAAVADEHDTDCQMMLAAQDYHQALPQCRFEAEIGNADSAFSLAVFYARGQGGLKADYSESALWLAQAAEAGHAEAAYNLAVAYTQGKGVTADIRQAIPWFKQSASGGNAKAQRDLATLFSEGVGVEKNLAKAFSLYQRSAEQGLLESQLKTGLMLLQGEGTEQNTEQAIFWLEKAALEGDPVAQYSLGLAQSSRFPEESAYWYRESAEQGNAYAMYNLSLFYLQGKGVAKNLQKALDWADKSILAGAPGSEDLKQEILQLVAGAQQASDWSGSSEPMTAENPVTDDVATGDVTAIEPATEDRYAEPVPEARAMTDTVFSEALMAEKLTVKNVVVQGRQWLLKQPDPDYVIQLARVPDEKAAFDYLNQHQLTGALTIYREELPDKISYLIVQGVYQTVAAANVGISYLPEAIRRYKPWVRSYAHLKQVLGKAGPSAVNATAPASEVAALSVKATGERLISLPVEPAGAGREIVGINKDELFESGEVSGDWLLEKSRSRIVVQLMTVLRSRSEQLKAYLKRHKLETKTVFYHTQSDAQAYTVLLYGASFEDKSEAYKLIKKLPPAIRRAKPWARSYGSLQDKYRPVNGVQDG
ncbi:MAG: hypothetical protein ACPGF7_06860 [Pontibacterium sp.]